MARLQQTCWNAAFVIMSTAELRNVSESKSANMGVIGIACVDVEGARCLQCWNFSITREKSLDYTASTKVSYSIMCKL